MKIKQIQLKNFRLLDDAIINIEDDITLIVGKNNTGKTSLFEAINIFTGNKQEISFEDFSQSSYSTFLQIKELYDKFIIETNEQEKEALEIKIKKEIPKVQLYIQFEYDIEKDSLINISEFITDLDEKRNDATILISYEPKDSLKLFNSFLNRDNKELGLIIWLKDNIKYFYQLKCYAVDKDSDFKKEIETTFKNKIEKIVLFEDIKAARRLDDTKEDRNKTLAIGFSHYYRERDKEKNDVAELERTLLEVSTTLKDSYEVVLEDVLKELNNFGATTPIHIPEILINSEFNSESVIKNNIKYYYKHDEIPLPESYNGLGYSNLIYMILELTSFIERFKNSKDERKSEFLAVMIEEPEAHMHPQMQQVFASQIVKKICQAKKNGIDIQLIITSHSSHIIAEAGIDVEKGFERIRYFNKLNNKIEINDFKDFKHRESDKETFRFLKQYLNLQKCDLFFADKVIMVEGITEKMLLPLMINKVAPSLNNEYISVIEAGGAYTNKFKELLQFIKVKTLVITDIDSVNPADDRRACCVDTKDAVTSNATLKNWIPKKEKIDELNTCPIADKYDGTLFRVAYQVSETPDGYVARSLEEAIINKNKTFFSASFKSVDGITVSVQDLFLVLKGKVITDTPYNLAPKPRQKAEFTFDLMTFDEENSKIKWEVPLYIKEGLEWLAKDYLQKAKSNDSI